MVRNYEVHSTPGLTVGMVRDLAQYFTGDDQAHVTESNGDFHITSSVDLTAGDQAKLSELCRIRATLVSSSYSFTSPTSPIPSIGAFPFENRERLSSIGSVSVHSTPFNSGINANATPQPEHYPNNFRVHNVPINQTKTGLQQQLESFGIADTPITVRSLARFSRRSACATITVRQKDLRPIPRNCDLKIDENFLSFTPLNDVSGGPAVDLVAIPGLGTHALKTFRLKSEEDVWLRDWLPEDVPGVRVLLYGYDSKLQEDTNYCGYHDLAVRMLTDLIRIRNDTNTPRDRPIVFLGHSLGGLLIKEMFVTSETQGEEQKAIFKAARGFLFFGVPNQGLKNDALKVMTQNQPNKNLIRDLLIQETGEPSNYLIALNNSFRGASTRVPVSILVETYSETHYTPTPIKIGDKWVREGTPVPMVSSQSASLPMLLSESKPLSKNHSTIIKFDSRLDTDYVNVIWDLSSMVEKITGPN